MSYEFSTLCYVRFLSGVFALCLVWLLWKRRRSQGAGYLILFELTAAIWAIGDGFEAAATTLPHKLHWSQVSYIGVTTRAVFFLMFALTYTNYSRLLNKKTLTLLMVIPLLTMIIALTNPIHNLLWSKIEIIEGTNQSVYYYGKWFWVNILYEYSALTAGIIILLIGASRVYSLHKLQVWIIIIGSMLPFCASILYVFKLTPVKGLDLTPISFILSGILVALSIFRLQMFNIMPIARKQAIDNLRDGMIIVDAASRIVEANPALCRILGMDARQIIGNQVDIVFSKINIDMDQFSAENDFTIETKILVESNLQDFEVKHHQVTDKNQKIIGRIFMFTDITTKKMILDAIADSNNRRKTEIIEKEKLIKDLDAYARSVAHDLKNPIGSVVNLSELIKISLSENNKNEAVELIDLVQDQSKKMIRIIDELLILSRLRKEDIKIIPVDIGLIVNEALGRLHTEIIKRKAIFAIPDHWPDVLGHEQWIEEVWVNIISNALKYGGIPPAIKMGFEKINPSTYRFRIQDNGNGLTESSMAKIFNDFERLGRRDIEGHGLGLPIVKRIIEKMGGEVKVESSGKPGEGCIFSFTLKKASLG
jgi:PAS domain S-box-containing protein